MEKIFLEAEIRKEKGKKLNIFRKKGKIPAILYGNSIKPIPLFVDYSKFHRVFKKAGESAIIDLSFDNTIKKVLIKEVQRHPVTDKYLHVDFYQIKLTEKIEARVPLKFIGEAPAVKEKGGVLVKNIDEVEVEALPQNLPKEILVDVSLLKEFSDVIKVKDLKVEKEVKILAKSEEIVATTTPPRSEEELKALEEKVEEKVEEVAGVKKEEEAKVKTEASEREAATKSEKKEEKKERKR